MNARYRGKDGKPADYSTDVLAAEVEALLRADDAELELSRHPTIAAGETALREGDA